MEFLFLFPYLINSVPFSLEKYKIGYIFNIFDNLDYVKIAVVA